MNNKLLLSIILVLLLVGGLYLVLGQKSDIPGMYQTSTVSEPSTPVDRSVDSNTQSSEAASGVSIDQDAVLSERILGHPEAPIRISEHSSFTCGHCGQFHKETYEEFKRNYIDTEKAYLVFSDFPLNAPALHASIVTRCAPPHQYFKFVQHLFEQQEHWAYDSNYLDFLKNAAGQYGVNEEEFKSCLQDEDLQKGILARMKAAQDQWDIKSTPTFVINNKTVISGALPYEELDRQIQEAIKNPGSSPSAQVEPEDDVTLTPMPESTMDALEEAAETSAEANAETTAATDENADQGESVEEEITEETSPETVEAVREQPAEDAAAEDASEAVFEAEDVDTSEDVTDNSTVEMDESVGESETTEDTVSDESDETGAESVSESETENADAAEFDEESAPSETNDEESGEATTTP